MQYPIDIFFKILTILLTILVTLIFTAALAGDKTIIRENNTYGQPDYFKKGTVVEKQSDGSYVAREEWLPGSGQANMFERGKVITPQHDGSLKIQRETLPGSGIPDMFDNGYTVQNDD